MNNENSETLLPECFDPAVEKGTSFDVLPVGNYVAQITDAYVARPKSGDGYYIGLTWQISEGEHEGRFVWQRITFLHSNSQATTIGRRQFKDLCVATGISEQVTDVDVFRFIPCQLKVGIQKDKQGVYPDKNQVSRILPLEQASKSEIKKTISSTTATAIPKTPAKPAATSSANGTTPPWRKQKPSIAEETGDEIPY